MSLDLFTQRVLPLKDKLFRFAFHLMGRTEDAEDAVQDVLLKIWAKRDEWLKWENPEGYCMASVRNRCLEKLRQQKRTFGIEDSAAALASADKDPAQMVQDKEVLGRIRSCMASLPEKHQSVMHLREVEGMSYQEIAYALDLTMEQVKVYLFRARSAIRQTLIQEDPSWNTGR